MLVYVEGKARVEAMLFHLLLLLLYLLLYLLLVLLTLLAPSSAFSTVSTQLLASVLQIIGHTPTRHNWRATMRRVDSEDLDSLLKATKPAAWRRPSGSLVAASALGVARPAR